MLNFSRLEQFLKDNNYPAFRFKQIKKAVFKDGTVFFGEMSALPKDLRELLHKNFQVLPFEIKNISTSRDNKSRKALFELAGGKYVETVLMNSAAGAWSVCVSSQAGCAMRCSFCATGAGGFFRNLSAEEIWGQVLFWKFFIKKEKIAGNISNVVYMGMGEPFNNIKNVFESLKVLTDADMFGLSQRNVSVSTCGILPGIEKFAREFPQVNLAVSLHAADDALRSRLMPVNKSYNLKKLAEGLKKYFQISRRKVLIEYILLDKENDGLENAEDLVSYLSGIGSRRLLHVNLIVFNKITGAPFKPSSKEQARKFKDFIERNGFSATIRKSLGQDIEGACGQLAGKIK